MNDAYRKYFDAMPCYLTVQDRDFRLVDANQRFKDDFGDITDRHCYQVYKNRSEKPDLLTLDLAMPGRDVGEVYELLREDPDTAELKICIITGRPELRKLIYDRSVRPPEGYLDKPLTEDALLRGVRKVLELAHQDA